MAEAPKLKPETEDVGLCASCRHARVIEGETSRFYLCEVSVINPAYPKYPVLPVLRCVGYKPVAAGFAYDGDDPQ